jgi:hypothetical protein
MTGGRKMKTQIPVLVLVMAAVTAVAQAGTIVHMDRKDSDDGKARPQSIIYAQDGQFRMDTLDDAGHVRDFVLVRDGNIWQVDMEKRAFMKIDQAALSGKQSEMQDRMQAMLQSLPPEKRAAMEARIQGMMAARSQPAFTMTDSGKSDQVGTWSCEIWQVRKGGTVSSDACVASRGSLEGGDELVDAVHKAATTASGVLSSIPAAHAAAQRMALHGQANGFPVRTRELEAGKVESELIVSSIEHRSLPADRFAIPKGFTQTTMGGGNE